VATCTFAQARRVVVEQVRAARYLESELVQLEAAAGRVLAESAAADRDYPPVDRSVRDGYAVRAADLPGDLPVAGEVRAGQAARMKLEAGQAIEIMTGAPIPPGADAVVMVEHTVRQGFSVRVDRTAESGQFINPRGSEAKCGETLLAAGQRLDFAQIALLATIGKTQVRVFRRPVVSILSTGDEVVDIHETPQPHQVRNSNARSLAVQVQRAGGMPRILPVAHDDEDSTRWLIEKGLHADLLLLSGGVSAGKYDIVEKVLGDFGADFYFDRVLIQPGQPLVFGRIDRTFFFGLPGNPASTMVTFEIFARAAVQLLHGEADPVLPFTLAKLTAPFRHKTGLTRFLPAQVSNGTPELTPIPWQGSSDVAALARANAFLVADAERESWEAGDLMQVLLK
jgi:molybdopterin molybdotransferase